MKKLVLCALVVVLALPTFASDAGGPSVAGSRLAEPTRLPDLNLTFADVQNAISRDTSPLGIRPDVVLEGSESRFVIPLVGSAAGNGGTFFRSETVIVNRRNTAQNIAIFYFPLGGGAANCTRPSTQIRMDANTWWFWSDFVAEYLGTSGLGAVIFLGVDTAGRPDAAARIDGNSRIWTPAPGTSGTASQNFPAVSLMMPAGPQSSFGLRHDEFYRSNYGIFNYDVVPRTFDIVANGLRAQGTFATNVDACSAMLASIPGGPYGAYELVIAARDGRANYFTFGSSVDNATGDSWSVVGRSF